MGMGDAAPDQPSAIPAIEVREARPDDLDVLERLSVRAQPNVDYSSGAIARWLTDTRGRLLVATRADTVVGCAHAQLVAPSEAWIEGLRVDPAAQRQGVGRILLSRALIAARELGADVARTMATAENAAAQALLARFGFSAVAEIDRYSAPATALGLPATGATITLVAPGPERHEALWAWLVQSTLTPLNGGLEMLGWRARAFDEQMLAQALAAGDVVTVEEWGAIQALAVLPPPNTLASVQGGGTPDSQIDASEMDDTLAVRYIDGLADGLGRLALGLRSVAAQRGYASVALWLPTLLILRDAMDGAGYAPHAPTTTIAVRAL